MNDEYNAFWMNGSNFGRLVFKRGWVQSVSEARKYFWSV